MSSNRQKVFGIKGKLKIRIKNRKKLKLYCEKVRRVLEKRWEGKKCRKRGINLSGIRKSAWNKKKTEYKNKNRENENWCERVRRILEKRWKEKKCGEGVLI